MDHYLDEPSINGKKKMQRMKYNKLSEEQKLEIIKEYDRSRLSSRSIAEKFSNEWCMKLNERGISEIISHWKRTGTIRSCSHNEPNNSSIVNELVQVQQFCSFNRFSLSKGDFKDFLKCVI